MNNISTLLAYQLSINTLLRATSRTFTKHQAYREHDPTWICHQQQDND